MDAIVEVETAKVTMRVPQAICLVTFAVPAVLAMPVSKVASTSAVVPSIAGTSISAVSPDYTNFGGTA